MGTIRPVLTEWSFLGPRVLHVSRHVPAQDGIARYAEQLEDALAGERTFVRLGVPGGGGDVVKLWGWLRPLRLVPRGWGFDDVLVEYHPSYFGIGSWVSRLVSYAALGVAARALPATWIVHEADEQLPDEIGRRGRAQFAVEERVRRVFWAGARRLVFHTAWERDRFASRFPARRRDERVVTHGSFFTSPAADVSQGDARRRLGLGPDAVLLLCIGYLSPHKGVDQVIEAVAEADVEGLELRVVGTPIAPYPHVLRHVEQLRSLAADNPAVHLHETYVDDEEFDLWIKAADAVVTAYRSAASSSVVARAHLLGTRLITSTAGGLAEQKAEGDLIFESRAELVEILRACSAAAR